MKLVVEWTIDESESEITDPAEIAATIVGFLNDGTEDHTVLDLTLTQAVTLSLTVRGVMLDESIPPIVRVEA